MTDSGPTASAKDSRSGLEIVWAGPKDWRAGPGVSGTTRERALEILGPAPGIGGRASYTLAGPPGQISPALVPGPTNVGPLGPGPEP